MYEFKNTTDKTKKTMKKLRSANTGIEIALRKALWKKGYRYRVCYDRLPGKPDIALTKYKIAIFCDGEFFHGKDWEQRKYKIANGNNGTYWIKKISRNIARDEEVNKKLLFMDWTVIRFWGKDINHNVDECVRVIEEKIFENRIGIDGDINKLYSSYNSDSDIKKYGKRNENNKSSCRSDKSSQSGR